MNEKFSIGHITSTYEPNTDPNFGLKFWVDTETVAKPLEVPKKKHSHYFKDVSNLNEIDVYRVIELFGIVDPCLSHALKKLLVTGDRDGNKSKEQDIRDVIASCNRWLEMQEENKR